MHPGQPFMAPPYPGYPPYGAPMGGPPDAPYGYGAPYMYGSHGPIPQGGLALEEEDSQMEVEHEESCSQEEISSVASKAASHAQANRGDEDEVDENESTQKRRMTKHARPSYHQSYLPKERRRWKSHCTQSTNVRGRGDSFKRPEEFSAADYEAAMQDPHHMGVHSPFNHPMQRGFAPPYPQYGAGAPPYFLPGQPQPH